MNTSKKCFIEVEGFTPLLLHNGHTANPLNEYAKKMKAITSKRKKTEDEIEKLLAIQWEASLYWDEKMGLYMPVENLQACLLKAAKMHKMGPKMCGFIFDEPLGFPLEVEGAKDLEQLRAIKEYRFVKAVTIQKAKALSCRAIFPKWGLKFNFRIDASILNEDEVSMITETASYRVGLGVWTPSHPKPGNHGRFKIVKIDFK